MSAELPKGGLPLNQFGPGEIQTQAGSGTGRWVYVGWNDEFTWRMGYCRELRCHGHETKDDAVECFKEWLLDTQTSYAGRSPSTKACRECAKLTNMYAAIQWLGWEIALCENHLNREGVYSQIGTLDPLYR